MKLSQISLTWTTLNQLVGFAWLDISLNGFPGKMASFHMCDFWKVKYNYFVHNSGWLIFKFEDEVDRQCVLERSVFYLQETVDAENQTSMFRISCQGHQCNANLNYAFGVAFGLLDTECLREDCFQGRKPTATHKLTSTKG